MKSSTARRSRATVHIPTAHVIKGRTRPHVNWQRALDQRPVGWQNIDSRERRVTADNRTNTAALDSQSYYVRLANPKPTIKVQHDAVPMVGQRQSQQQRGADVAARIAELLRSSCYTTFPLGDTVHNGSSIGSDVEINSPNLRRPRDIQACDIDGNTVQNIECS
ncbi:hypothetical protein [Sinorhizobium meliloti]|uniref:hypothetical protein n=1 Tax=Rhizobium meliloti TaxID=382 RepID=UPI001297758F|nr:hypothetical protein [Sinorhizobium meliloti]MQW58314.1 hypothetical protein [Sinorhizobium meliloti]